MRKPIIWDSYTNQPVQSQKKLRSLKHWIKVEEELCYPCGKNKGADQLCQEIIRDCTNKLLNLVITAQLLQNCNFAFTYEKRVFSYGGSFASSCFCG